MQKRKGSKADLHKLHTVNDNCYFKIPILYQDQIPDEQVQPGKCRVILPDIAGVLPVYQYDEYKGYETKTIPNLTDEEIERYKILLIQLAN